MYCCHLPPGKDILESKQHRKLDQRGGGEGGEREIEIENESW